MSEAVLVVDALSAGYGQHQVLTDISLSLARGEWFSLLGPNGSGKTTLIHCITGQLTPRSGGVRIGGNSLAAAPELAKEHLGFAHPPDRLPSLLTGRQCLEVYAAARKQAALDPETLQLAQGFRLEGLLDQFVDTYSLGTRQKLSILLALMGEPALIVLDEAFNGLDPRSALILKRYLQERVNAGRCAVLLATHALDIVLHYSSRAALLKDGRLGKTWSADELQNIRARDSQALELALAEV